MLPVGANQFPGGFNSRCGPPPFHGAPSSRVNQKEERRKREKNERNGLTLTGLLMEGVGGPKTTLRKECDFWDDLTTE
jgi:hypothetical protein